MSRYKDLKERVLKANLDLVKNDLVVLTWGNVSEYDRDLGVIAIKPSGVSYDTMTWADIVVLDIDGEIIEGRLKPSSDTPTHLELYRCFPEVNGIAHTHSRWATIWAQAGRDIPALGTTHADYFYGAIPCTDRMTDEEISEDYELNTGRVIVKTFRDRSIEPTEVPAVICYSHGPFSWGDSGSDAVHNAIVMEYIAMMAKETEALRHTSTEAFQMDQSLLDKHFLRKHGATAYYGQGKG